MAINVADVITEYGDYYLGNTAQQSNLFADLYRGIEELEMGVLFALLKLTRRSGDLPTLS